MDLHVVGGFLGSGKTTAIANVLKVLLAQDKRVGVITNDKGRHLVDTAFLGRPGVPVVEVHGGCFRCSAGDFRDRIAELQREVRPDVIFAESVGSCVDLVGPVLTPLAALPDGPDMRVTYSVFIDARVLRRRLAGQTLPFSDNIVYILDQQLEEAGVVVANKMDLLSPQHVRDVENGIAGRFPGKTALLQTSLTPGGVRPWLETLAAPRPLPAPLVLDYGPYVAGAAELAWFDEVVTFTPIAGQGQAMVARVLGSILGRLRDSQAPVAHLKILVEGAAGKAKFSFTVLDECNWCVAVPALGEGPVTLTLNARVQMDADRLQALMEEALRAGLGEASARAARSSPTAFAPQVPS